MLSMLEELYLPARNRESLQLLKQMKLQLSSPWEEREKGEKSALEVQLVADKVISTWVSRTAGWKFLIKICFFCENADPVKCGGFPLERMSLAGFLN